MKLLWCTAWLRRDANGNVVDTVWCACKRQPKGEKKYRDHMATRCGKMITLPVGIEYRNPTCNDCLYGR